MKITLLRRKNWLAVSCSMTVWWSLFMGITGVGLSAEAEVTAMDLLNRARRPPLEECWAILQGEAQYKIGARAPERYPIELRAVVGSHHAQTQLIVDRGERYFIEQEFGELSKETRIVKEASALPGQAELAALGLDPNDLTLAFLFWTLEAELGRKTLRGQPCRLLKLVKDSQEYVIVWIAVNYEFPLRVEWFQADVDTADRVLDFVGFKKVNDIWILKELRVERPRAKTILRFNQTQVEPVSSAAPLPLNFFIGTPSP